MSSFSRRVERHGLGRDLINARRSRGHHKGHDWELIIPATDEDRPRESVCKHCGIDRREQGSQTCEEIQLAKIKAEAQPVA